jgi:sugar O-acyltransferase (sialic acid O-acetyltransferase NeuD family)
MGYLDQNPNALRKFPSDYNVVGDPLMFNFDSNDYVLLCLTKPDQKENIVSKIRDRVNFFTFIAPNAILGKFINIGTGGIVCPNACISTNVTIGDYVFVNAGTQIGHDCKIGEFSSLMAHIDLGGRVNIGKKVFMGTNSTIIPGVDVNDNITIGTGSIVIQDLRKPGTYFGNPANLINYERHNN